MSFAASTPNLAKFLLDLKSTHDTSFNVNGFLFIAGERSFTELVSFSFHEYQVSNP